jgi:hypothetical protein
MDLFLVRDIVPQSKRNHQVSSTSLRWFEKEEGRIESQLFGRYNNSMKKTTILHPMLPKPSISLPKFLLSPLYHFYHQSALAALSVISNSVEKSPVHDPPPLATSNFGSIMFENRLTRPF